MDEDEIEYGGSRYVAVVDTGLCGVGGDGVVCAFIRVGPPCACVPCSVAERADGRAVIFVEKQP